MVDAGGLARLVIEQTARRHPLRIAFHSPELFATIHAQKAYPSVLTEDGGRSDLLTYIALNADFSNWTLETAIAQLKPLQEKYDGMLGPEFRTRLQRLTAERLYELGKRLCQRKAQDGAEIIDACAGILFPADQNVYDCYLELRGRRDAVNGASMTLDLSLEADADALRDRTWLHLVAPIAYAAAQIPGLVILDSLGKPRQMSLNRIKRILAAAVESEIDYEHSHSLTLERQRPITSSP